MRCLVQCVLARPVQKTLSVIVFGKRGVCLRLHEADHDRSNATVQMRSEVPLAGESTTVCTTGVRVPFSTDHL